TTHVRPDGDGLGSMLALADTLQAQGKEARLTVASTMPARYRFLDPSGRIEHFHAADEGHRRADVVIVLDTGTWHQLGDSGPSLREFVGRKVVVDHLLTQDALGALRLVDTSAEATGRLVFEAITALDLTPAAAAAQALFVALAMDTGWFRHSNTAPATF